MACRSSVRYRRGVGQRGGGLAGEDLQELELVVAERRPRRRGCRAGPRRRRPETKRDDEPGRARLLGRAPGRARRRRGGAELVELATASRRRRRGRSRARARRGTNASPRRSSRATASPAARRTGRRPRAAPRPSTAPTSSEETSTRLVSSSASEPPVLALAAPVQPRVPDGDGGLLAQAARELDLLRGEAPLARVSMSTRRPSGSPPTMSGTVRQAFSPHAPWCAHVRRELRVRERLLHDLSAAQDLAVGRVVVERVDGAQVLLLATALRHGVERAEDDRVAAASYS